MKVPGGGASKQRLHVLRAWVTAILNSEAAINKAVTTSQDIDAPPGSSTARRKVGKREWKCRHQLCVCVSCNLVSS